MSCLLWQCKSLTKWSGLTPLIWRSKIWIFLFTITYKNAITLGRFSVITFPSITKENTEGRGCYEITVLDCIPKQGLYSIKRGIQTCFMTVVLRFYLDNSNKTNTHVWFTNVHIPNMEWKILGAFLEKCGNCMLPSKRKTWFYYCMTNLIHLISVQ